MSGEKRILDLLLNGVAEGVFPGAVLLVAHRKEILLFEAAGNAAVLPTPRPMTLDTIFDLASLTKPLATGLVAVSLLSQGKLQLDASLLELMPGASIPDDKQAITLRQLLCHCSGLPSWKPYYLFLDTLPRERRKERLRQQILKEPLKSAPGTTDAYSDLGFMLVEWILEEKSGEDLHHFTREHVFGLLDCATPQYLPLDQGPGGDPNEYAATEHCPWRGHIISGEVHDENAYVLGGVAGHAGLFGTAVEVKCVLDTILDTISGSRLEGPWSRSALLQFLRPQHIVPNSSWALAFDTPAGSDSSAGSHFSSDTIGHLGFTGTSFWLDLSREMAVVFLTNRVHPSRDNDRIKVFRPLIHDAVMKEFT